MQKNEVHLCDIVARLFEEKLGAKRTNVTYPDRDNSSPPDERPEVRFDLAGRGYVIEHTLVEPFSLAIQADVEFATFHAPILSALNGHLPKPGIYTLQFPIHPTARRPKKTHRALQDSIMTWVRFAANELHAETPQLLGRNAMPFGYVGKRSSEVGGVPLTLHRRVHWSEDGQHDGKLFLVRTAGADLEAQRRSRIGVALDKKLGKLAAYAQRGDVAVLVLESSDISLSNHALIGEAVEAELGGRTFRPHYIFIADTALGDAWELFCMIQEGNLFLDMEYVAQPIP